MSVLGQKLKDFFLKQKEYKEEHSCSYSQEPMLVDLVYTWVNSSDPKWIEKKAQFDESIKSVHKEATDKCRFQDNDELKYSLRSVEKFANWINKIYIVTDEQIPEWLNTSNEKICIIDHKDILPKEILPTYNACAIENAIINIKGLSEYFLYANDDMFFWNNTTPEFFFEQNKPIIRIKNKIKKYKKYTHLYGAMVYKAYLTAKQRFNKDYPYFSHHNIDSYRKSLFTDCISEFQEEFSNTANNRFRALSDMQRMIVSFYSLAKNEAVLKDINTNLIQKLFKISPDSDYCNLRKRLLNKLLRSNSKLVCINDCRKTTDKDREYLKEVLNKKFPDKSQFEK